LPFRATDQHLRDILESISSIETFLGDMDFDVYRGDLKTKSAVERQLQIITEAAVRLGRMGPACVLVLIGRAFEGWETYCGTGTIESTTRSFGTR